MVEKINKFDKIECPNHLQPRNYAYHGDGVVQKVIEFGHLVQISH
jgi:hypothetical protein